LVESKKRVIILATARRISSELSATKSTKFELKKIKEFICWPREDT